MSQKFHLVERPEDLEHLLAELTPLDAVALDTEADSLHHYREKLCLIQLGAGQSQWIVDPLAAIDLTELLRALERRELILHGADYDLRLLHRTYHFKPERIFDTMLAAQMLGRQRIGLAALVEEFFGVVLPKKAQKADWSLRPLSREMLEYAADDTRYLARTAQALRRELEAKGRLAWHAEICRRQIAASRSVRQVDRAEAWRIKGGKHLTARAAAVLRELWQWREESARRADRPPFKIASNEFLLHWAEWAAEHPEATLSQAPPPPAWLIGGRLKSFNAALGRALALTAAAWPAPPPPREGTRRRQDEELLLGRLIAARDEIAGRLGLDPGVLGARETLREVVRLRPREAGELARAEILMDWQIEALEAAILALLRGQAPPAGETALGEAAEASGLE